MNDLVFIYLGANLPRYVPASLRLAERHSGLDVTFIGNRDFRPHIPRVGVDFVDVESFYAPSAFAQAGAKVSLSADFRGGFWLKTLERLFVLEQFMAATARKSLLHAELDQLTFRVDLLLENLLLSPRKGIFFPFHSERKAVASVLFCNDIGSISDLLMNASSGPAFENEMELLVRWALASPDRWRR